jgi:hypothetical protein
VNKGSELDTDRKVLHRRDEDRALGVRDRCRRFGGTSIDDRRQQSFLLVHRRRLIVFLRWLGLAPNTRWHELQPVNSRGQGRVRRPAPLQIKSSVEDPWPAGRGSLDPRAPCGRCSWHKCLYREAGLESVECVGVTGQRIAGGRLRATFDRPVQEPL